MPHLRKREALPKLLKRLKLFPVVALQGARQTGKSFLARELFVKNSPKAKYLTFDMETWFASANERPITFIEEHEATPLVIDEAQKVPKIFEAIKYKVDLKRIAGKFLLLGSTEFSLFAKIQESLTGRMGRIRIYPMNIKESLGSHFKSHLKRVQILQYLKTGGLQAVFSIRDDDARSAYFEDWLRLTCSRDIFQFKSLRLDPEICLNIFKSIAKLSIPTKSNIAKELSLDPRVIDKHLSGLCELFVLQKVNPHRSCRGKPIYYVFDVGLAHYLGANEKKCLEIFLMNERLTKNSYHDVKQKQFYYYKSGTKNIISLIEESIGGETLAIQILAHEGVQSNDSELMKAFLTKNSKARGLVLAPIPESFKIQNISFHPWEYILKI
jgi:predicted AAA+ superfamily ATPase